MDLDFAGPVQVERMRSVLPPLVLVGSGVDQCRGGYESADRLAILRLGFVCGWVGHHVAALHERRASPGAGRDSGGETLLAAGGPFCGLAGTGVVYSHPLRR